MSLLMGLSCALCACGPDEQPDNTGNGGSNGTVTTPPDGGNNNNNNGGNETPKYEPLTSIEYRTDFTPTKFDGSSAKYEITQLGTGVCVVKNTVVRKDGKTSTVFAIDVDLNFVDIVAGTKNNETTTLWDHEGAGMLAAPYAMAQAWEQAHQGGHVYASLNADFFGSSACNGWVYRSVNAFVKDGVILKAGHNDTGNYDYKTAPNTTGPNSDVPASAPMLFGIKGNKAQIAPIIQFEGDPMDVAVKEKLVKAKLFYGCNQLSVNGTDCPFVVLDPNDSNTAVPDEGVALITQAGSYDYGFNTFMVKLDPSKGGLSVAGVNEVEVLEAKLLTGKGTLEVAEGEGYLLVNKFQNPTYKVVEKLAAGDKVKCEVSVASPDGTWNGYTTILGTRQTLVLNGEVPATITKENTNGAQSQNIPRSAVGIMPNGHVVIFAVEDLHYYKTSKSEDDTYGMNLPTLAEFMKFYGVEMGTNFDGGGSTQLVMRGEDEEMPKVYIRAADTAFKDNNTEVLKTRVVINSILVTNKVED